MEKNSFVLYSNYFDILKDLSNEDAGILFKAILQYQATKEEPELPLNLQIAFKFIKNQFDIDDKKYNEYIEKQKANGLKGGRPRKEENPKNPTVFLKTQKSLNDNDNDNVNDNDNDNDNDTNKKIRFVEEEIDKFCPVDSSTANPDIAICFEIYRKECPNLAPLGFEPRSRDVRQALAKFLEEVQEVSYFEQVCRKANSLKYIANHLIDFKSLINNHIGIMNGKYEEKEQGSVLDNLDFLKEREKELQRELR